MESTAGITPEEIIEASFGPFQQVRIICLDSRLDTAMPSERNILLHQNPTFEHVQQELATKEPGWTVLQPVYGPNPYWKHADQNSPIGATCRSLYAINRNANRRYVLAVVRASKSDRPLPIFETPEAIIQAIIVANPDLENKIESFTRYSDPQQDARTELFDYDRLEETERPSFPTAFILTMQEPPQKFQCTVSSAIIPPFLQIPFVNCKDLLRSTYNLKIFPLQMIHVSSALLHAIICLAEAFKTVKTKDIGDLHPEDVREVAFVIADELEQFLDSLTQIVKNGEEGDFDNTQTTIDQTFTALCGDYPGAANIRRSHERFKELQKLDQEEAGLSNPVETVRTIEEGPVLPRSEQHELSGGSDTTPVEIVRTAKERPGAILVDPAPVIRDSPVETVRMVEEGHAVTPVEGFDVGEEEPDPIPAEKVTDGASQSFAKHPGVLESSRGFLKAQRMQKIVPVVLAATSWAAPLEEVRGVTVGTVDEGPVTNPVEAAFKGSFSHNNTNVPLIAANLSRQTIAHEDITGDIERAISEYRTVLEATADSDSNKPMLLNRFAICLESRFRHSDTVDDLQEAASSLQTAVELIPDGHPAKPALLTNLGDVLQTRSALIGDLADLKRAISNLKNAAELTPDGHPNKPSLLYSLGSMLLSRFQQLGNLDDLNQAISLEQTVVKLTPDDYLDRHTLLNSVGNALRMRFERTGDLEDIGRAIESLEIAADLTPDGYPEKPSRLSSLGAAFQSRFGRLGNLADREKSISFLEKAMELIPGGQPINNGIYIIANVYHKRFVYLEDANDATPLMGHYNPENRSARWQVRQWGDGKYSIKNVDHNRYADSGNRAVAKTHVEGNSKERLWHIQALPTGGYTIATTDTGNLWMLRSDIADMPVELFDVPTDRRCWWTFKDPKLLLAHSSGQRAPESAIVRFTSVVAEATDLLPPLVTACEALRVMLQRAESIGHVNEEREALIKRLKFNLATVENDIAKLEEDQKIDKTIPVLNQDVRESLETYATELKEIHKLLLVNRPKDSSFVDEVTIKTRKIDEAFQGYTTALHQFAANTVAQMQQQVAQFRQEFQQGAHTVAEKARPNRPNAYGIQHRECLQGTREKTLPAISDWVDDETTEKWIFFFLDVAGSGKSTVAKHMAEKWKRENRLLARFFFSRDTTETMSTNSFCSTVAGTFADLDPDYKSHMDKFMAHPDVELLPFEKRFEGLVAGPLRAIGRRAILIIDALDECHPEQRDQLLQTLRDQHISTPFLRILATGRPERDIKRWANDKFGFGYANFIRLEESEKDVELYIKHRLQDLPIAQDRLYPVICHAEGLFIWARIACDLLLDIDDIDDLLEQLGKEVNLDYLYKVALEQSMPKEGASRRAMVLVLQMILAAREPLSIAELEMLSPRHGVVEKVVARLGSVLLYQDREDPIRLLHHTFREFLTSQSKADIFFIQPELGHHTLASGCLNAISYPSKQDDSTLRNLDAISQRKDISFEQDTY